MTKVSKQCRKCGEEKPITEFYVHPAMGDGRLNKCKSCAKRDVSANYAANIEHYKEYERRRANLPHRVEARSEYAATPRGRERGNAAKRAFTEKYPFKKAASVSVNNAIRDGRMSRQPCEVCGATRAQAHHDDYTKPLDVRWLCTTHHAEWHKHNTPLCPDQEQAA